MPVDPEIAAGFSLLDGMTSYRAASADPEQRARLAAATAAPAGYVPPRCTVRHATVTGPHGPVPLRIYLPEPAIRSAPGLVWAHGGAFISGGVDMPEADMVARELCHRAGAVVVSVDYRLAVVGVCYPVPLDDVVAAWRWAARNTPGLGVDPSRLALGGASAGGNLAAAAALRVRDEADPVAPAQLLLAYPLMHHPLPPPSPDLEQRLTEVPRALRLSMEDAAAICGNYLGEAASTGEIPGYAMPGAAGLAGLPPTVIIISEYDDLRTSGEAFAGQLTDAGVPVTRHLELGVLHGHLNRNPKIAGTDRSLGVLAGALLH